MARSVKVGLDYFELDCHPGEKLRLIEAEFGLKGFAVVVKLHQKIYGELGYYCEWNDESSLLFALENGASSRDDKNLIEEIISACIRRDIFSENLFNRFKILTSARIQENYIYAVSRREKVELKKEYLLINVPENIKNVVINPYSVNRKANSVNRNKHSREEKSRVEKSRVENSNKRAREARPDLDSLIRSHSFPPELETAVREWITYKSEKRQAYQPTGLKAFLSRIAKNAEEYGAAEVAEVICYSMSENYQGVIFDRLKKKKEPTGLADGWPIINGTDWSKV